jgi:membrane protease YdiL (CAAX protease family)
MPEDQPNVPPFDQEQEPSEPAGEQEPFDPMIEAADPRYSVPDVPMARPVSIGQLSEQSISAADISSSAVRLTPWRAIVQLLVLLGAGFAGLVLGSTLTGVVQLPDERWDNVMITAIAGLVTILAAFLMVRSAGQPLSAIGWRVNDVLSDTGIGLLSVFCVYAFMMLVAMIVALINPEILERTTQAQRAIKETIPPASIPALILMMVFVSVWEEVVFRGFLLTRLYTLFRRWWVAVIIGALLFAVGHIYQGVVATMVIGGIGIVLGLLFVWRRSLLPPVVFHVAFNTIAVLVLRMESETWQ